MYLCRPMQQPKKIYTVDEATRRLENFCAYQERCHEEVQRKLKSMHMIPQAIDHIIAHLIQHNFLNETRFAEVYVRSKFNQKHWGKHRLKNELKRRQISEYNICMALKQIDEPQYLEKLRSISQHKWSSLSASYSQTQKKQKLFQYLQYRGWEAHLIYAEIQNLGNI